MIILGIDPGTATTGYGIIHTSGDVVDLIKYGCIKTSSDTEKKYRLKQIYEALTLLIDEYNPDILAVELLFFNKNTKTALSIGEVRGIIFLACAVKNVKLFEYTPLQVKNTLVGYGRADKNQMKQMVQLQFNLEKPPTPDDAADAVAIALCHLASEKMMI
ncbi:MAG: crossover junction endodeoxyribonuclease RuvC [Armatimonadota bacterium]